jgi:uncharacterized membrane protein YkvA (DUF1232 family)
LCEGGAWYNVATVIQRWKERARALKLEVYALYLAYRDPRVSWPARIFAACVVAYAFSPIDLIPDPIPVLGYLDDLVLIPLGVMLARKLIPPVVLADCRERAEEIAKAGKPVNWVAAVIIVAIWVVLASLGVWLVWEVFAR